MGELPQKKKKKRKKRRRKRKRAEDAPDLGDRPGDAKASRGDVEADGGAKTDAKKDRDWGKYVWPVLLLVGLFEVWMFGRRGHIEVCVAKEGVHDFALLEQKRTDENTRQYPSCERRLNLGITSDYDEAHQDAMLKACHRANILRGKEATLICAIEEDGWKHRVTTTHCPPWHDHYYQRMFWFLQ